MDCFCNNNNSATTLPHKTSNTTPEMRFDKNMFPLNVEHLQKLSMAPAYSQNMLQRQSAKYQIRSPNCIQDQLISK